MIFKSKKQFKVLWIESYNGFLQSTTRNNKNYKSCFTRKLVRLSKGSKKTHLVKEMCIRLIPGVLKKYSDLWLHINSAG